MHFDSSVLVGDCLEILLEIHEDIRLERDESIIVELTSTIPASPTVQITQNFTHVLILDNDREFNPLKRQLAFLNLKIWE